MKKTVAVIFDEKTKTHALRLLTTLSGEKYYILPVFITGDGKWLFYDHIIENANDAIWEKFGTNAILSPDKTHGGFLRLVGGNYKAVTCDAVMPLAKTAQITALCKLAGMACVGAKNTKQLLDTNEITAEIADKLLDGVLK